MKALIFWEDVPVSAEMYLVDATPDEVEVLKAAHQKYHGLDDDNEALDVVSHAIATKWKACKVEGPVTEPVGLAIQCGVMSNGDVGNG